MPGYYLHLAACKESSLENRSFVLGVEAPDMLKKHVNNKRNAGFGSTLQHAGKIGQKTLIVKMGVTGITTIPVMVKCKQELPQLTE